MGLDVDFATIPKTAADSRLEVKEGLKELDVHECYNLPSLHEELTILASLRRNYYARDKVDSFFLNRDSDLRTVIPKETLIEIIDSIGTDLSNKELPEYYLNDAEELLRELQAIKDIVNFDTEYLLYFYC